MGTPARSHIHIRSRIRSLSWIWSLRYNLGVWLSLELSCLLFALQIDELPIEMRHNIYATLCPCYAPCGLSPVSERQLEREREREYLLFAINSNDCHKTLQVWMACWPPPSGHHCSSLHSRGAVAVAVAVAGGIGIFQCQHSGRHRLSARRMVGSAISESLLNTSWFIMAIT